MIILLMENIAAAIITVMVGAILWLFRTVFTNNKRIELLEKEIKLREEIRQQDRDALKEVQQGVNMLTEKMIDK